MKVVYTNVPVLILHRSWITFSPVINFTGKIAAVKILALWENLIWGDAILCYTHDVVTKSVLKIMAPLTEMEIEEFLDDNT